MSYWHLIPTIPSEDKASLYSIRAGQACMGAGQACTRAGQACTRAGQACIRAGQACIRAGQARIRAMQHGSNQRGEITSITYGKSTPHLNPLPQGERAG